MSSSRVPVPPITDKEYTARDEAEYGLKFTSEKCSISGDDDKSQKRAVMSCGHAVAPNYLTGWCRSLIDTFRYVFYCPAVIQDNPDPRKAVHCKKEWPYKEVCKLALLNDAERMYFEAKLSELAAPNYCDMKECPGCRSFVERKDLTNLRVHCLICTKKKKTNYDFCWNCLESWTGPSTSGDKCGNSNCEHPQMKNIRGAPKINLVSGNIKNVPSRRACPNCGSVQEHDGSQCKMMACKRCHREYCFACLQFSGDCLKTGRGYYNGCKKPVAPEQTSIPTWKRS
eukprot:m.167424 g.167424  ORF g.167424 m.167424 type:complete len:284 (+) comp38930_c1_seq1:280-1131(+)